MRAVRDSGLPVIAINTSVRLAPWAAALYACDLNWWRTYREDHETFAGEKWSMDHEARRFGVNWVRAIDGGGLSGLPGVIRHGRNSGHQAVSLALAWGARRVILLGFDCGPDASGRKHWHADHPARCGNPSAQEFDLWERSHAILARDCAAAGLEIINASRATRLECYRRASLLEALREP